LAFGWLWKSNTVYVYHAVVRITGRPNETILVAELEATVGRDNATGRPRAIRSAEHGDRAGDFFLVCLQKINLVSFSSCKRRQDKTTHRPPPSNLRIVDQVLTIDLWTNRRKRGINRPMAHLLLELLGRTRIHISRNRSRVNSVNCSTLSQLSSPRTRHALQRSFRAAVNALVLETQRGTDAADIDNTPAAVMRQVGNGGFHEEERAADVDVVELREVLAVAVFDCEVGGDAGVVDDDVDLKLAVFRVREVVLGQFDDVRGAVFGSEVGLHGEALDVVGLLEFVGELLGLFGGGVGGVVDYEVGAFGGEVGAGCGADAS
jgi:hypothetical protein